VQLTTLLLDEVQQGNRLFVETSRVTIAGDFHVLNH
jgi:hypothetical protein